MEIKQLDLVIRLAAEQCSGALERLGVARAQWQSVSQQMQQLQDYQAQYVAQAQHESQQGISVQALAEGRRFIGELDGLIATQQQSVDQQAANLQTVTEQWIEAARYQEAVERLREQRLSEQVQRLERHEQQRVDDLYAVQHVMRAGGLS